MKRYLCVVWLGLAWAGEASAITVDGTRDAEYGSPVAVQAVDTHFGDANPPTNLGGSELDAAYALIEGGRLYLLLTGNHEPNFNKLEIFIDSVAGGENTFSSTPQYDFETSPGFWNSQNLGGMDMDASFTVDYHLFSRWGGGNTPGPYEADFVNRQGGTNAMVPGSAAVTEAPVDLVAIGSITPADIGPNASGTALTQNLDFAINNNNQDGVFGGTGPADQVAAAAVTTGMEFSIALADIGNPSPGSTIKISAMINNSNHNYLSNQFLGPLVPPQVNLGGDGTGGDPGNLSAIDLNNFAGNQFFTITVPGSPGLTGDYNNDGKVDAADYVVWRKNDINGAQGYTDWVNNFGEMLPGGGGGQIGGVPEPASLLLLLIGVAAVASTRRR